jgi:hypothetical protein
MVASAAASYMSPEQARGKPVDKRTDIWAYGCLLFEMLTGRRAFSGETLSDTVTAVLTREPDWKSLPEGLPSGIQRLLKRCLEKDVKRRLRDIGDARIEIEDAVRGIESGAKPERPPWPRLAITVAGVLVMAVVGVAGFMLLRFDWPVSSPVGVRDTIRFGIEPPEETIFSDQHFALSPDGRFLAHVVIQRDGRRSLWVRPFGSTTARELPGTENATFPFWAGFHRRRRRTRVARRWP